MQNSAQKLEKAAMRVAISIIVVAFTLAFSFTYLSDNSFLKIALPIIAGIAGTIILAVNLPSKAAKKEKAEEVKYNSSPEVYASH